METLNFAANDTRATVPFMEECKPFSLPLPPIRRLMDSPKLTDSISKSESLPGSVECLSSASSGGYVKVEPVINCTDYTGVEPKARVNRSDDTEEGTLWKIAYGMTKEDKDRLSNMKEEEEGGERQSVKMESDDGVKYGEGIGREQDKAREEWQRNGVTDQTCQTHICLRNGGNVEYGKQEGAELSTLVTTCLLKQPRVLMCRLKITDISVFVSPPPPHPMASKEDWGVKVPHTQHELSTLKGSCSLRQKDQVMTWKKKMIGQMERTQKQLPVSSENRICVEASHNPLVISPRNQNTATVPFMEECKPFSLPLPPIRRLMDSPKLTDSISKSESLPGSVECLSSASSGGYVKVEPVINCTDYTGVEPKARLNRSDDTEEGTLWKIAYGMTKEEKDRLSNMKEEEEGGERQSVKMESDDGVKYGEGIGREQEKAREEWQRNGVTDQTCQTHICLRNGGNAEYGKQEGAELSTLATACLLKQPRVLMCRLKITDISVFVSPPPPHPMASKEDRGVKGPHTQHELSTLKGSCSLRQKDQVMTWKKKMIGQMERTQKQLPVSSENGICVEASHNPLVISPRNQNTGTLETANGAERPLCKKEQEPHMRPCSAGDPEKRLQAELKQEPEEEPFTPGHPLPGSAVHAGEKCLLCKLCGKLFDGADSIMQHQLTHHGGKRFRCTLCGKGFTTKHHLKTHLRVHTGEKPHICNECGKSFAHLRHLKTHQIVHTGEKPHICNECGKSFADMRNLKTHQRVHTGEKPHSCDECGKTFTQLGTLKTHQRVHTGEKPHSCDECGKTFTQLGTLKTHQRVHTEEKPHSCDECRKSFAKLSNLKSHQRVHTGEKLHICNKCGKSFARLHHLKSHQRVHTGEKPHSCDECGKSFAQLTNLKNHQRVHTGEKLHSCDECGKSFAYLNVLKVHQRVHTGEKPHSCDECGKTFTQLGTLKTHQRVHTGEKPHSCDECGKTFTQLGTLKTHQRVHTEEKPHSCDECGKSFAHLSNLKTHQRVHTGEKPHSCNVCGKSFAYLHVLKAHQSTHRRETAQL